MNQINKILNNESISLFGYGIVNPMGPTFMGFSLNQNSENTTELNHYSINPFSQSTSTIEEYQLKISDFNKDKLFYDYNIPENIDHFLQKNQTGTPTLMFINNPSNDSETWTEAAKIASNIITLSSDPLTTYNNLKKFPNNVMERVSFEMNSIYSGNEKNEFIDEQKVLEMVMMFADQAHITQEMKGFLLPGMVL